MASEKSWQRLDRLAEPLWQRPLAEVRDQLITHYWPFAKYAGKYAATRDPRIDPDDAVSEATLGLIQSIDAFKPGTGAKFTTFCSLRVNGQAAEASRQNDWVNHKVRRADKKLRERLARGEITSTEATLLPHMNSFGDAGEMLAGDEPDDPVTRPEDRVKDVLRTGNPVARFYGELLADADTDGLRIRLGVSRDVAGLIRSWTVETLQMTAV